MIVGPSGVGKTTLVGQFVKRRAGISDSPLLGLPVESSEGRSLYIGGDRPRQIARSFGRMVSERDRVALDRRIEFWRGPLPFDLGRADPGQFLEFVSAFSEVDCVVIDSLKDVAVGLSDDEVGARVNQQIQSVIASGREVVELHHQRKSTSDNRKPTRLDDVYGSTWITAGAGSVLLLWGEAGDALVELRHLKQPAGEVPPMELSVDHDAGTIEPSEPVDLVDVVHERDGILASEAAELIYGPTPSRSSVEKVRRRLEKLADGGQIARDPGLSKTSPVVYRGAVQ